jgi:anti-sigma regulatory factor (Ser/Thr protein kinase)
MTIADKQYFAHRSIFTYVARWNMICTYGNCLLRYKPAVILITAHTLGRSLGYRWHRISFASTLYLEPILDVLVQPIPAQWQTEVRLGLHEALVNAAKHGNNLDPSKQVLVQYANYSGAWCWVITDQGEKEHTTPPPSPEDSMDSGSLCPEQECGRGFFILNRIFDRVQWDWQKHQLSLWKQFHPLRQPLIS